MSTRAMFTFQDKRIRLHVYKHHDGYPEGAVMAISKAFDYAWDMPRFEADEFSAAFVAGNKGKGGGAVRLLPHGNPTNVWQRFCSDIEFRYELYMMGDALQIRAFATSFEPEKMFFHGVYSRFLREVLSGDMAKRLDEAYEH